MRRIWRTGICAGVLLAFLVCGTAVAKKAEEATGFHPAASPAEKTLDSLLRLSEKDDHLLDYVLHTPQYKDNADYARLFTKHLLDDMAAMEQKAVQDNCAGKYVEGEICGVDYNPLTCSQDGSEAPYQYKTESSTEGKAVIVYKWRGEKEAQARFDLMEEGGAWMIDAVRCR